MSTQTHPVPSSKDVQAQWLTSAMTSWLLLRRENGFNAAGDLANHLWMDLDAASRQWGDRPLPPLAPSALELLKPLAVLHLELTGETRYAASRVTAWIARHANAWGVDKKGQPVKSAHRSLAVNMLQDAVCKGSRDMVKALLAAPDAPANAANQQWWKFPEKHAENWRVAAMGEDTPKIKQRMSLGALALLAAHHGHQNEYVLATARDVLKTVDLQSACSVSGARPLDLCTSGNLLPDLLSRMPPDQDIDDQLLSVSRLLPPAAMGRWFGALAGVRPDTAIRLAPQILEVAFDTCPAFSRSKHDLPLALLDVCCLVCQHADIDPFHTKLPQSGLSVSDRLAHKAVIDQERCRGHKVALDAKDAWALLSRVPSATVARPDAYWGLWAAQDYRKNAAAMDFFTTVWSHPEMASDLHAIVRSNAPPLSHAMVDLLGLDNEHWSNEQLEASLDTWADGMLQIQPEQVSTSTRWTWELYDARKNISETMPEQWLPIKAVLGVPLDQLIPDGSIEPSRMVAAIGAWQAGKGSNPASRALLSSLQMQYAVGQPSEGNRSSPGPRF